MNGFQLLAATTSAVWHDMQPIFGDCIRLALVLLFCVSGYWKLRTPDATLAALHNFGFRSATKAWAVLLGFGEVGIALALVATSRAGTALALAFLSMATALTVSAVLRGRRFPCSCFGPGRHEIGWATIGRNVLLLAFAILLFVSDDTHTLGSFHPLSVPATAGLAGSVVLIPSAQSLKRNRSLLERQLKGAGG